MRPEGIHVTRENLGKSEEQKVGHDIYPSDLFGFTKGTCSGGSFDAFLDPATSLMF